MSVSMLDLNAMTADFVPALVGALPFIFVFSTFGLLPAGKLERHARRSLTILDFFALQLIIALTYAYFHYCFKTDYGGLYAPLVVGCWCIEVLWWYWVATRTDVTNHAIWSQLYITTTVLFAFMGPVMVVLIAALLLRHSAMAFFQIHVWTVLFLSSFWTTRKYLKLSQSSAWAESQAIAPPGHP